LKKFEIPAYYHSNIIGKLKTHRRNADKLKRDFEPTLIDLGGVKIFLARHFGFCYGVENAVEIAYKAIAENQGKKVYLLSEMIHNPEVNADLRDKGLTFILNTDGTQQIPWNDIFEKDIVIVPAFGTTLEIQRILENKGINPYGYDTTCPFVEKVWKRAGQIAEKDFTIIIHGKPNHEETRATYSHSSAKGHSIVIQNIEEAALLAKYISAQLPLSQFFVDFTGRYSAGFDPEKHLHRLGVVNQTTMLASETQGIADFLKKTLLQLKEATGQVTDFADTRDTLCYATNDNQTATQRLLQEKADFAIVVGGYNSSNTTHLVELCQQQLPTYFIENEKNLLPNGNILSFDIHTKSLVQINNFLEGQYPTNILLTCGASCPDSVLERVLLGLVSYFPEANDLDDKVEEICSKT
jgi:4-hydroxy-3-methylbut-2-en-1-yl diphosphate reductase